MQRVSSGSCYGGETMESFFRSLMESFFRSLNVEQVHYQDFDTCEKARDVLFNRIEIFIFGNGYTYPLSSGRRFRMATDLIPPVQSLICEQLL